MTTNLGLSASSGEIFNDFKQTLHRLRPDSGYPSGSVAIEFLVWWFEQTITQPDQAPNPATFSPVTRNGRPRMSLHDRKTHDRPVSPAKIREGLDLVSPTARRKL